MTEWKQQDWYFSGSFPNEVSGELHSLYEDDSQGHSPHQVTFALSMMRRCGSPRPRLSRPVLAAESGLCGGTQVCGWPKYWIRLGRKPDYGRFCWPLPARSDAWLARRPGTCAHDSFGQSYLDAALAIRCSARKGCEGSAAQIGSRRPRGHISQEMPVDRSGAM